MINDKNLISLEEIYETQNSIYFITEICEGGNLRDKMAQSLS